VKKVFFILFVLLSGIRAVYADDWGWPVEKDYFSENNRFVAHVTPPKYLKKDKPLLEVFEIKNTQRVSLFRYRIDYMQVPVEVYVSDDGEYVVTVNEHGKVGYGGHVVAFYEKKGCIKNYSMEEILHLPKNISNMEISELIPHSTTSRWWDQNSIKFLDKYEGRLYFCIWLDLFNRWIAWSTDDGKEVRIDDKMMKKWNNKARLWSLQEIKKKFHCDAPYRFLGNLKNPEDRRLIEKLLSDEEFIQGGSHLHTVQSASVGSPSMNRLELYYSSSSKRLLAEQILANWNGRPTDRWPSYEQPLYYLGKVEGTVSLPQTDNPKEATLWLYLVPASVPQNRWYKKAPVQHLVKNFAGYGFFNLDLEFTTKFPFAITAVTPGKYWIKAVLDKTKPLSKTDDPIYLPQPGDYQSLDSTVITVEAGKTVENITIDCAHKVTNPIN